MQVREFLEPVKMLDEPATLADATATLSANRPVFVRSGGSIYLLTADAAVGFPSTRRLIDVPLTPAARAVGVDDDIGVLMSVLLSTPVVPVRDNDEIIGCVDRGRVLAALAGAVDPEEYGALLAVRAMPALLHDLANSLTVADASVPDADADAEVDEQLAAAHVALRHAGSLLRRVRALTTGRDDVEPTLVDVNAVLDAILPLLRVVAGSSIQVELELAPGLPTPKVRARSIERAVLNLVLNARDAITGNGAVRVSTYATGEGGLVVEIDDDGPGVPAGKESSIFRAGATTKDGQGRGLGLSSAAAVLRRFGASIALVPSRLGGACFRIVMPGA